MYRVSRKQLKTLQCIKIQENNLKYFTVLDFK